MARKKREKDTITFEVRKPPSDITFIPPDSILEPYPKEVRLMLRIWILLKESSKNTY